MDIFPGLTYFATFYRLICYADYISNVPRDSRTNYVLNSKKDGGNKFHDKDICI